MMWLCTTAVAGRCSFRTARRVAKLLSIFPATQISFTLQRPSTILSQPCPLPPPPSSLPSLYQRISPSLSTHYANMRYQFDGDPRLFLSPILIARPVDRLILAFAYLPSCQNSALVYIELNVFNVRFSRHWVSLAGARSTRYISDMNIVNVSNIQRSWIFL